MKNNYRMLVTLVFSLLFFAINSVFAGELTLSLFEKKSKQLTYYSFNTGSLSFQSAYNLPGVDIPKISMYAIDENYKLVFDGQVLSDATEILFQGAVDGVDLVVIREEYNSYSSVGKIFSALGGHPIQVSKIILLQIKDHKIEMKKEVVRKESSYHWAAYIEVSPEREKE